MVRQKPFFPRPVGESEIFRIGNTHQATTAGIDCELCGTTHPELHPGNNDGYTTFTLFGRLGVLECCGAILDQLYHEWGPDFTSQRLNEFGRSPLDAQFGLLRVELPDALHYWARKAGEAAVESSTAAAAIPA